MATFSDGGHADLSADMSGYAPYSSPSGDMRFQLQSLLDIKEKQLQQAGTLGQQLLAQRMELEERIRQLQELDLDGGDGEDVRERYRELADTIKGWDAENEQLSSAFGLKPSNGAPTSPPAELPRGELERSKASGSGTTAVQSSRRAKNAAHRADDVEFAFEIGSGLLTEVRRLQSLLAERDKALQDMKEEKDDLEKTVESLRTALRQQEQSADKFKEENWNLEVTLQELRTNLTESQATTQRLEGEQKRLTRLLTTTREAVDLHKNEAERHLNAFQELKAKHDTDVAQYRRTQAGLQRDKLDLQASLEQVKDELANAQKKVPRFGSPLTPNGAPMSTLATPAHEEDDMFSTLSASTNRKKMDNSALFPPEGFDFPDESPENSPSRPFLAPNHPSNEIEALQQRLAHAQRQINTLKGSLQREKEMRIEYKRKLDSSMVADNDDDEDAEGEEDMFPPLEEASKSKPRLTPFRAGKTKPRAKGRGGLSLMQRLAAQSPSNERPEPDDDDDFFRESSPPPRKSFSEEDILQEDSDEEEPGLQQSPSSRLSSKRTSVEGMDPAFANVLRRSSSGRSFTHGTSPLRHSVLGRSARGRGRPLSRRNRGGAAFQQVRPPSFAGEPEALANELGELGFGNLEDTFELPENVLDTTEVACQTDFEEPPVPSVIVTSPSLPVATPPSVAEFGVQVYPEPVRVPARTEVSSQTVPVAVPALLDSAVQHDDLSPRPILLSAGVSTDAEVPRSVQAAVVQTDVQEQPPQVLETPKPRLVEMDIQTMPEVIIVRQDADIQTLEPVAASSSNVETQTTAVPVSEIEVQTTESSSVASSVPRRVFADTSVGDSSVDTTVTIRPTLSIAPERDAEDDDGTATETGSVTETDTDDYVDARQSISLVTPTESLEEDYHSILTVTDNDFSESDGESIKASRLSSRQNLVTSTSSSPPSLPSPSPSPPPRPAPTYESVGVSADLIEERKSDVPQVPDPIPALVPEPKPELKEMSIQTDEPSPAPSPVPAAPPSPAIAPSPTLVRVGPASQQFQFISPPPSAGPTTTALPLVSTPSPNTTIRDSASSFIPRPRTSHSDRRQSIESTLSSARDEALVRSRTPSNVASVVDKSRPPMMVLPPPPRQPPPPNAMPPPSFIPERRQPTASNASQDAPPPRPSSPPPPELIQRATTPTFGAVLSVPSVRPFGLRHHPSSMTSSQGMRQPPSTSSFRSAGTSGRPGVTSPSAQSFTMRERERREQSTTSLTSGGHSIESQRSSVSSDHLAYDQPSHKDAPATPERRASRPAGGATDPAVIHAITQTMIGEFLYKYTRKTIGKGYGERRHKRFFWVHPYTRTLYWSSADPGSSNVSESSAKSAYVEAVRSVLDPNPMPPGIYQYSVVVSTPQREMKITAPTKERHDIWLNALQYLLTRPSAMPGQSPGPQLNGMASPASAEADLPEADGQRPGIFSSPQSQRSVRTSRTVDSWNSTPRGQRSHSQLSMRGSMGKRSGTPAAEYLRWGGPDGPYSPTKSFEHIPGNDDEDLDFELHDETLSDDGFEGLENVRACCDGRHTVGRSGKIEHLHHHHHHHHPPQQSQQQQQPASATLRARGDTHLDPNPQEISRPLSPAWSFRSRSGSTASNDGTGFFSRFGSRRSAKTSTTER